jgi:hypothetical protein
MDFKLHQFSAGELAKALGISDSYFQNLVRRSDAICLPNAIAGRRLFSAESAFKYACVNKLASIGISPKDASWPIDYITFQMDPTAVPDCRGDVHPWIKCPTGRELHMIFVGRQGTDSDGNLPDHVFNLNSQFFPDGIIGTDLADFEKTFYSCGIAVPLATGAIAKELNPELEKILRARG